MSFLISLGVGAVSYIFAQIIGRAVFNGKNLTELIIVIWIFGYVVGALHTYLMDKFFY